MPDSAPNHSPIGALSCDVLVVGGGPAGLALAAQLATRGCKTTLVAAELGERWTNSYGSFLFELQGLELEGAIKRVYEKPLVYSGVGEPLSLGVSYARLDTSYLQSLLFERCGRAGVRLLSGRVESVSIDEKSGTSVAVAMVEPGPGDDRMGPVTQEIHSRMTVNAAGAGQSIDGSAQRPPTGYQSAYGQWIQVDSNPFGDREMALMDYRASDEAEPATFLYAMPESGEPGGPATLFVQETALITKDPVPMDVLRERLGRRLDRMGIEATRTMGMERCVIPMGMELPTEETRLLPFGAAAGLVHPATGYQLTRALRLAPQVAEAIHRHLPAGAYAARRAAMEVMWPSDQRRAWRLFELGGQVLRLLPPEQMRRFVEDFFSLGGGRWERFMSGTMDAGEIAGTMWRVFAHAPNHLRAQLIRGGSMATARAFRPQLF